MAEHEDVIETLYGALAAVPSDEFGSINLLPFSVDNDQVNALKREVAKGLTRVLGDAGHLAKPVAAAKVSRSVSVKCRSCSTHLANFPVTDGTANVPAVNLITALSKLSPECPHGEVTADTQRVAIEQAFMASMGEGRGRE